MSERIMDTANMDWTKDEPIVRCRDCKWFMDISGSCARDPFGYWDDELEADVMHYVDVKPDDFCSKGKRS